MNSQIKQSIERIASDARNRYQRLLELARTGTVQAAGRVQAGKKPVNALSNFGLKLSAVSHRTTDKLLKQQARTIENQFDTVALRLNKAATARSIRDLFGAQVRLVPEQLGRFATDTRTSFEIVANAGAEAGKLLKGTVTELRGRKKTARKVPAAKTAAAKKTTRKKAARKTVARKATARKSA